MPWLLTTLIVIGALSPTVTNDEVINEDNFTLKIGVIDDWSAIVNESLRKTNFTVQTAIVDIDYQNIRSQYDKMLKVLNKLKKKNIHCVIGSYDYAIATVTEELGIPYLSTTEVRKQVISSTYQLIPDVGDFGQAIIDLVVTYGWERASLFYDDEKGVPILEKLLAHHRLLVKSWRVDKNENSAQIRDHLVNMRRAGVQKSILICSGENVKRIIEEARSLAMLSTPYEWFLYDPGSNIPDVFENFRDIALNFTIIGLFKANQLNAAHDIHQNLGHDAATIIQKSLETVNNFSTEGVRQAINGYIKQVRVEGETGLVEFRNGHRFNFTILLTEQNGMELYDIGYWKSETNLFDHSLVFYKRKDRGNITTTFPLRGRTATVVMILETPFTMMKPDAASRSGNDRFEGYAVDLIREVAKELKFDYNIYLVHDGKFGAKNPRDGQWNGMIGELISGNATMSVAPLSINSQREEAVDFTKPFMTRYISVLIKVPASEASYFEFMNPLHPIVWVCTFGAFVVVSIILYMLEKVGNSHSKEYPAISFRESLWLVFGSLLQGSTDSSPSTLPGRILVSAWWFFALILISSYTANLAAFLTVKKINTPIKSVTDLASQTKIKYGTVKSSGIMSFFQQTTIEHFAKMWAQMSEVEPGNMVDNATMGILKVKEGDYAFFWDTTVNKYKIIEDCELMEIGPHFDPKGFGIGVPPGATYREELSMSILRLSDMGLLHALENKWWGRRTCPDVTKPSAEETSELQIENVAGVFFILLGGIVCAIIAGGFEHFTFMMKRGSRKQKHNNSMQNAAIKERESFL